jgi:hypothetical protein
MKENWQELPWWCGGGAPQGSPRRKGIICSANANGRARSSPKISDSIAKARKKVEDEKNEIEEVGFETNQCGRHSAFLAPVVILREKDLPDDHRNGYSHARGNFYC